MIKSDSHNSYTSLTPRMIIQLAAPHTWAACIIPTLVATALVLADCKTVSILTTLVVLTITILMQSTVNALNDYFDYVKGADTIENQLDPTDAVLVYNNVNPHSVKLLCIVFVVLAFLLGIYVIYISGLGALAIALVAVAIIYLYSGGKTPISYLPIGEVVSGFTMGTLIMVATYLAHTGTLSLRVALLSLPVLINIGLILMANNTCDIEKDIEAQRKTLPVLIGRKRAIAIFRTFSIASLLLILLFATIWFRSGLLVGVFMILAAYPQLIGIWKNPFSLQSRVTSMAQIISFNIVTGLSYALIILMSSGFQITLL